MSDVRRRPPGGVDTDIRSTMDALRRIFQALRQSARTAEKQVGISGAQLFVLHQLADHGALSVGDLAERTFTHHSSVSVVVSRLVTRGLVSRTRSSDDGRRMLVTLTANGSVLLRQAPAAAQVTLIEGLRRLPTESRQALAQHLTGWVRATGMDQKAPRMLFENTATEDDRPRLKNGAGQRRPRRA